jgi:hypothetical protein
MWTNPFFPGQQLSPVEQIKAAKSAAEDLVKYIKEQEKAEKDKKEEGKIKLPQMKFNIFELTFLTFAVSPVWYLLLGHLWAKILGLH